MLVAPRVDRPPVDIVHDEVGQAFFDLPAIDDSRNGRMIQRCENLTFLMEPAEEVGVCQSHAHDLDRHFLVEGVIGSCRQIHGSHAAMADFLRDAVGTETPALHWRRGSWCSLHADIHCVGRRLVRIVPSALGIRLRQHLEHPLIYELSGGTLVRDELSDLAQLVVTGALAGEKRRPFGCITRQRSMKELRDLLPPLRVHEDLARFERRTSADPTPERIVLLAGLREKRRRRLPSRGSM